MYNPFIILLLFFSSKFNSENCENPSLPSDYVNVLDFDLPMTAGADDLPGIQNAIDSVPNFGTLYFPQGHYYLDVTSYGFKPHSNMTIIIDRNAILEAIPCSPGGYSLMSINDAINIVVSGGAFLGERHSHLGTDGAGGHCLRVSRSKNVKLLNILVQNCWGDGVYVTEDTTNQLYTENLHLCNVISDGNRRSAMSIVGARNVHIKNSQFMNSYGSDPQSGVNLEPNSGQLVFNVTFDHCVFTNNSHYGLLTVGFDRVDGITCRNSIIYDNFWAGVGISRATNLIFVGNYAYDNQKTNLYAEMRITDVEFAYMEKNRYNNSIDYEARGVMIRTFNLLSTVGISFINNDVCVEQPSMRIRDITSDHGFTTEANTFCERNTCSEECDENAICFSVLDECKCKYGEFNNRNCKPARCTFPYCKLYASSCDICEDDGIGDNNNKGNGGVIAAVVILLAVCLCLVVLGLVVGVVLVVVYIKKKN